MVDTVRPSDLLHGGLVSRDLKYVAYINNSEGKHWTMTWVNNCKTLLLNDDKIPLLHMAVNFSGGRHSNSITIFSIDYVSEGSFVNSIYSFL